LSDSLQTDQPAVLLPEVLGVQAAEDGVILSLRIPKDLAYFDGHFDQIAIVPGVAQIQWAVHFARLYLGLAQVFSHMESVKFKELLLPGQVCELSLLYLKQACKLEFRYRSESAEYSSGRLYFHEDGV